MEIPHNAADLISKLTIDDVMDVIEQMESGGDLNAIGDHGKAYGPMQIQQVCLDDFKRWNNEHTIQALTLADLQGVKGREWSRLIFRDYVKHYATEKRLERKPTYVDMARIWNGGPNGWNRSATRGYGDKFVKLAYYKLSTQQLLA